MAAPWLPKSDKGTRSPSSHFWHLGKLVTTTTESLPPWRFPFAQYSRPPSPLTRVKSDFFRQLFKFPRCLSIRVPLTVFRDSGTGRSRLPGVLGLEHVAQRPAQGEA